MNGLEVRTVSFDYTVRKRRISAVRDVSFRVAHSEFVCLKGQSGSGKSTLINLAAGLEVPKSGEILVNGTRIDTLPDAQRAEFRLNNIGVVFQDHNLISEFTALENVLLVLRCQGTDNRDEAIRLLDAVGVGDLADRLVSEMSGGQRQRVGIARALAGGRKLLLCDEPTGSLDRTNADRVYDILHDLTRSHQVGVVVASHDPFAVERADHVITLEAGVMESAA